jgi:hypothetical protein
MTAATNPRDVAIDTPALERDEQGGDLRALADALGEVGLGVSMVAIRLWRRQGLIPGGPYDRAALLAIREWYARRCVAGRTAGRGARRRRQSARKLLRLAQRPPRFHSPETEPRAAELGEGGKGVDLR